MVSASPGSTEAYDGHGSGTEGQNWVKTGPSAWLCEGQLIAQLQTFVCQAQSEAGQVQIGRTVSAVTRGVTRRK
jgi:hypothetical protein